MDESKRSPKTYTTADGNSDVDVIVLGVGTCGEELSLRLLDAGLDVVGIEASLVGGECAYWACLPSKMMIRAASLLQEARRVNGMAGKADVTPDWDLLATRVRTEVTGDWDDSIAVKRFEKHGGRLVHGRGMLTGPRTVAVGDESFTARRGIVIATGSKPAIPPIPGLAEVAFWTTHDVIQAQRLPKSITIIGGGAVGCELGQVLARFGSDVTIVEAGDRILPSEEPEASEVVQTAFAAEGIDVHTGSAAQQVKSRDGAIVVTLGSGAELASEHLLIATGRTVDLRGLGLESAGLDESARFIEVDDRMRAPMGSGLWATSPAKRCSLTSPSTNRRLSSLISWVRITHRQGTTPCPGPPLPTPRWAPLA